MNSLSFDDKFIRKIYPKSLEVLDVNAFPINNDVKSANKHLNVEVI